MMGLHVTACDEYDDRARQNAADVEVTPPSLASLKHSTRRNNIRRGGTIVGIILISISCIFAYMYTVPLSLPLLPIISLAF